MKDWKIILLVFVSIGVIFISMMAATGAFSLNVAVGDQGGNGNDNDNDNTNTGSSAKQLKIPVKDFFSGADSYGTLYIYEQGKDTYSESLAISSGTCTTTASYAAGTVLNCKFVNGSAVYWQTLVVPALTSDYPTYNVLTAAQALKGFTIGTYATDALKGAGSAISDAGTYNSTTDQTPIFKYELTNTGATDTGLRESVDAVTGRNLDCYVVAVFSGTGSETIDLSNAGFDSTWFVGTTQYGVIHLNAASLSTSKDALGAFRIVDGYKTEGTQTVTWNPDFTAYTSGSATMQIYAYANVDAAYAEDHSGNFGTGKVELAEQTVTIGV